MEDNREHRDAAKASSSRMGTGMRVMRQFGSTEGAGLLLRMLVIVLAVEMVVMLVIPLEGYDLAGRLRLAIVDGILLTILVAPLLYFEIIRPVRARIRAEIVTERRQELLLLAAAIEHAGEAVLITDREGTIQYVNPAFETITGYSAEEAQGRTPRVLKSGQQDDEFYDELWSTLHRGETWQGRFINRRKDGELYTQDTVISPVRTGGEGVTHMVSVFRDVSGALAMQDQLHQAQKMEAIGKLAGGIAHDFNNVLTAIKGHSQFVLLDLPPEHPVREDVEEIVKASDRAAEITGQLLAFSKQQVSQPEILDLNEAVADIERMIARLIGEHIEMVTTLGDDVLPVLADRAQLHQVLMNLAVNARDAMPDGGRIDIRTRKILLDADYVREHPLMDPGPYVLLSVSDTGEGIPAGIRDRVFEPFFTTKSQGKGTGLGLSTVYGIVKQAGGFIWLYSEVDEGTTFKIYLPEASGELADHPETAPPGPTGRRPGTTVLLAEDDDGVRSLMTRILERRGFRVLAAANGTEALEILEEEGAAVDLLLTDVVMPGMGGRELASRAAELRPDLPVLFASGYAEDEVAHRGLLEAGIDFMEKPFNPHELIMRVERALDRNGSP